MESTDNESSPNTRRPYCIQGSEAPIFRGKVPTDDTFSCPPPCGNLLIENYDAGQFINIGIKCFKCGNISYTPQLESGEIFAARPISMGKKGGYFFGSTAEIPSEAVLTCDEEIQREIAASAPKDDSLPYSLTPQGLSDLALRYDEIVGGGYDRQSKKILRNPRCSIKEYPFPWAIDHLEACVAQKYIDMDRRDTCTALMIIQGFCRTVGAWQYHPRFSLVMRDLRKPYGYFHTISLLMAADHLWRQGNRIGLSLEDKNGQPNPDLYVRVSNRENIHIEVKAPAPLQTINESEFSQHDVKKTVKKHIAKSRRQINTKHPGVLVIFSSYIAIDLPDLMKSMIEQILKSKGRDRRGLAAVVWLSPVKLSATHNESEAPEFSNRYQTRVILNPHYQGYNPVVIKSS